MSIVANIAKKYGLSYMKVRLVADEVLHWEEGESKPVTEIQDTIEKGLLEVGLIDEIKPVKLIDFTPTHVSIGPKGIGIGGTAKRRKP